MKHPRETRTLIHPRPQNRRRKASTALLIALPLLALPLAGCTGTGNAPADSGSGSAHKQQYQDWELKFVRCLQSKGIDIPDPDPVKGAADVKHDDAYKHASSSCFAEVGDPPVQSGNKPYSETDTLEAELKAVACMREHGLTVTDPKKKENGTMQIDLDFDQLTEEIENLCLKDASDVILNDPRP